MLLLSASGASRISAFSAMTAAMASRSVASLPATRFGISTVRSRMRQPALEPVPPHLLLWHQFPTLLQILQPDLLRLAVLPSCPPDGQVRDRILGQTLLPPLQILGPEALHSSRWAGGEASPAAAL